jgi:hypothetical protein
MSGRKYLEFVIFELVWVIKEGELVKCKGKEGG